MKTNTFGFLLFVFFAVSSLTNVLAYEDDLFDSEEFDALSALDEKLSEIVEYGVNKALCKEKNERYTEERCLKSHCILSCSREGFKSGKCKKSKQYKVKKCFCYKDCENPTPAPANPPTSPAPAYPPSSPAPQPVPPVSPAPQPVPPVDPPCDDDFYNVPPASPPSIFGQFSDEDLDDLFS